MSEREPNGRPEQRSMEQKGEGHQPSVEKTKEVGHFLRDPSVLQGLIRTPLVDTEGKIIVEVALRTGSEPETIQTSRRIIEGQRLEDMYLVNTRGQVVDILSLTGLREPSGEMACPILLAPKTDPIHLHEERFLILRRYENVTDIGSFLHEAQHLQQKEKSDAWTKQVMDLYAFPMRYLPRDPKICQEGHKIRLEKIAALFPEVRSVVPKEGVEEWERVSRAFEALEAEKDPFDVAYLDIKRKRSIPQPWWKGPLLEYQMNRALQKAKEVDERLNPLAQRLEALYKQYQLEMILDLPRLYAELDANRQAMTWIRQLRDEYEIDLFSLSIIEHETYGYDYEVVNATDAIEGSLSSYDLKEGQAAAVFLEPRLGKGWMNAHQ